jgi:hypothetical protein
MDSGSHQFEGLGRIFEAGNGDFNDKEITDPAQNMSFDTWAMQPPELWFGLWLDYQSLRWGGYIHKMLLI